MKRVILGVAAIALLGFTSCKKDYTCECTYQDGSSNTTVTENHTIKNATLDDAKSTCDGYEDDGIYDKTCTLL